MSDKPKEETALDILKRWGEVCGAATEHETYHSFEKYEVEGCTTGEGHMRATFFEVGFVDDCTGDFIGLAEKIDEEQFAERIATSLNLMPRLIEAVNVLHDALVTEFIGMIANGRDMLDMDHSEVKKIHKEALGIASGILLPILKGEK